MFRSLVCALALSLFAASTAGADRVPDRTFGVVPQESPLRLAEEWQPLLDRLQVRTGIHFHFVTAPTVADFQRRMLAGDYDYAYANAMLCHNAQTAGKYRLLVRRDRGLHGIIVVRRNGPRSLAQLRGQIIAYPAPSAFGATLLNRAYLKRLHLGHRVAYLGTHESVYRAVAEGQFVAGGGIERSFRLLPKRVRHQLRVLYRTPAAPSHGIAARVGLDRTETRRVQKALLALGQRAQGRNLLATLDIKGFRLGNRADERHLSSLGLSWRARPKNIDFLVIPRLNPSDTLRQMEPLAVYFEQRLEIKVALHTYNSMQSFDHAIYSENGPALINANPLQAIRLARKGYTIIAQQLPVNSPDGMYSVILVPQNSPIRSLADLRGKRVAFGGGPDAFFASVVPRVMLKQAGLQGAYIDASQPGPVSNVIARLRKGDIDAACTGAMALHSAGLKARYHIDRMRVLARGAAMPGLAWLVSPEVGPEVRSEIRHLLLGYSPNDPGHSALTTAAGISGLKAASRKDYRLVEHYMWELRKQ